MSDMTELSGQHIFITGGAGFIGSSLIGKLIERNSVTVYDNFSRDSLRYKSYRDHPHLKVVQGDILDVNALKKAIQGASHIVHAAGIAGIDTVIQNPVKTMQVNMIGSANLLEAAAGLTECKRVVCFSTSEVFGQIAFRARETSHTVLGAVGEARWTYAVSKLAEEHMAYAYFKQLGLPTVTVRPFNVYGPEQVGEGAIKTMVHRALLDEPIYIHGDGTQIRAWCYVDDMIDGILRCLTMKEAIGESFNIGNERTVITVYGLASTIIRVLGSKSQIFFGEKKEADIELRIPQVNKAKEMLGFSAKVDLEEGIKRTAESIQKNLDQ
ncbi:NAD-dependent epimerase/dehydratase family protein [Bacillus paralicheniformis]|uniref:NAD-dependent epimerase/dehydratase family protein n=1 Tax=Bacillus paralicheniformis TaxID=1648923 RepID=UPI00080E1EC4|nr:NAD-dependent epimerase/dehydratase family protein [Bacillus paralicheniformis]TAI52201.1 epimerase [Bacillus paralicheniformis]